jgi:TonB family protein
MNSAINFILESGVSLSVFALIYILFLRKETFFKLNRLLLLSSVLFSVLLPFLKFRIYNTDPVMLAEITVTPYRNLIEAVTVYGKDLSGSVEQAILSANLIILIYMVGVIFFLGRFLFRIVVLYRLISKNQVQHLRGFNLVTINKEISPFSFLKYVFVSNTLQQNEDYPKMIAHELEHVKQGHTYDVIILELLLVFQWFNPFFWMMRRAIRENHEYLADQAVLKSGINRGYYKKLLLNQFVGVQFKIANNFNYSLIKNRRKMMSRIKSSKFANVKIIFGLIAAAMLVVVFACEKKESFEIDPGKKQANQEMKVTLVDGKLKIEGANENLEKIKSLFSDDDGFEISYDSLGNIILVKKEEKITQAEDETVYFIVEDMPEFPGGESALRKYITSSIEYPEIAVKNGIQGKVYVTFVVKKDGSVANAKIARGVDLALDKEALRVVNSLPKWKPGIQRGTPVNVSYTVPINFMLDTQPLKEDLKPMALKSIKK